jgi:AcrR family transcriptional regulator
MLDASKQESAVDGRKTRWDDHKARRRVAVLDAAVTAIEQDGPDVGVKLIAELVGLPRSVVYRHFQDRSDLDTQIQQHIVDRLMVELAPTLRPDGTPTQAIRRAIDVYLGWIERHPRLHAFLGAGSRQENAASQVATGTKAAIAVDMATLLTRTLGESGAHTASVTSLAFGVVGFVDATVNHWLADRERTLTQDELAEFLTRSIWSLLDGNLRALGVRIDPHARLDELTVT